MQPLDPTTRLLLEEVYAIACSFVVLLAKALGKPSPLISRGERRAARATIEHSNASTLRDS